LSNIFKFWGGCDLLLLAWWAGGNIIKGEMPVYFEINQAINTSASYGNSLPIWLTVIGLLIYISLVYSGVLFIRLNPKAVLVSYIQLPFRIVTGNPSLFFVPWIAAKIFTNEQTIILRYGVGPR